ncbi:MAG: flagellar basal body-associated FliL family protein [Hyphomonadaceae bacterium]|nr:flagellar basal body-associated FliL family protein [Hyphomonadaceae bacterium]
MAKEVKSTSEAEGEGEGEAASSRKRLAGKTLVLFIILPALVILGGGGATAFFLFGQSSPEQHEKPEAGAKHKKAAKGGHAAKGKEAKEGEGAEVTAGPDGVLYYPLPEMLVNITTGDGRPVYLKLRLTVEVSSEEAVEALEAASPRVLDQFQAFLRELRVDDIAGSAGAYRLRLELLRRVNLAIAPAQANAVLIEDMLVQ